MERVDDIYRGTVFDIGYDLIGMGFEIAEVSSSSSSSLLTH
jgi:hypothetical protein